ncbi:DUF4145 domain-containing protein [Vibrio splendidus]
MLHPQFVYVQQAHVDMPEDCKNIFNEARDISSASARGSAALLRLCIQLLMVHLEAKGNNINENIADLVSKGLSPEVQQALDFVRVTGNEAVHPGTVSLDDNQETINYLFMWVNYIVEDRISRPKKLKEMYNSLPEGARKSIEKRDNK